MRLRVVLAAVLMTATSCSAAGGAPDGLAFGAPTYVPTYDEADWLCFEGALKREVGKDPVGYVVQDIEGVRVVDSDTGETLWEVLKESDDSESSQHVAVGRAGAPVLSAPFRFYGFDSDGSSAPRNEAFNSEVSPDCSTIVDVDVDPGLDYLGNRATMSFTDLRSSDGDWTTSIAAGSFHNHRLGIITENLVRSAELTSQTHFYTNTGELVWSSTEFLGTHFEQLDGTYLATDHSHNIVRGIDAATGSVIWAWPMISNETNRRQARAKHYLPDRTAVFDGQQISFFNSEGHLQTFQAEETYGTYDNQMNPLVLALNNETWSLIDMNGHKLRDLPGLPPDTELVFGTSPITSTGDLIDLDSGESVAKIKMNPSELWGTSYKLPQAFPVMAGDYVTIGTGALAVTRDALTGEVVHEHNAAQATYQIGEPTN